MGCGVNPAEREAFERGRAASWSVIASEIWQHGLSFAKKSALHQIRCLQGRIPREDWRLIGWVAELNFFLARHDGQRRAGLDRPERVVEVRRAGMDRGTDEGERVTA